MEKYIKEMKENGLQEYEAKAYYILLSQGNLNAKEVSLKTDIPQSKVYSILSKLIKKGICSRVPGQEKKYKALEPKVAFSPMKHELEKKQVNMKNMVDTLGEIYIKESNKTIDDYIEVLTNNEQIQEKYLSLKNQSTQELIAFVKPPFAHEGNANKLEKQEKVDSDRLKKGVVSRAIYEIPKGDNISFLIPHIQKSVNSGEEARMLESVPLKLHIFDRRYVLMALNNVNNSNSNLTMLAIEHIDLAHANIILFEHLWEKAIPFEEYKTKYLTME